jgi:hypothetical protein
MRKRLQVRLPSRRRAEPRPRGRSAERLPAVRPLHPGFSSCCGRLKTSAGDRRCARGDGPDRGDGEPALQREMRWRPRFRRPRLAPRPCAAASLRLGLNGAGGPKDGKRALSGLYSGPRLVLDDERLPEPQLQLQPLRHGGVRRSAPRRAGSRASRGPGASVGLRADEPGSEWRKRRGAREREERRRSKIMALPRQNDPLGRGGLWF